LREGSYTQHQRASERLSPKPSHHDQSVQWFKFLDNKYHLGNGYRTSRRDAEALLDVGNTLVESKLFFG